MLYINMVGADRNAISPPKGSYAQFVFLPFKKNKTLIIFNYYCYIL